MVLAAVAASITTFIMLKPLAALATKAPVLVPPDKVMPLKRTSRTCALPVVL